MRGEAVFNGYREINYDEHLPPITGSKLGIGTIDQDGYVVLTGRKKELINCGGEMIAPQEIDNVANSHSAVKEAAAFAMPHETLGEAIGLAVAWQDERDSKGLRAQLQGNLSKHQQPQVIFHVRSSKSQKILRTQLWEFTKNNNQKTNVKTELPSENTQQTARPPLTIRGPLWKKHGKPLKTNKDPG